MSIVERNISKSILEHLNTVYMPFVLYSFPAISFVYEVIPVQSNILSIFVRAVTAVLGFFFYSRFSKSEHSTKL